MNFHERCTHPAVKNPNHENALTWQDLILGRRVILFDVYVGIRMEATVVSLPFVSHEYSVCDIDTTGLRVLLLAAHSEDPTKHYLSDLGIVPFRANAWHDGHFVVDVDSRDLLPTELQNPSTRKTQGSHEILRSVLGNSIFH
jgi:hypothetical protein